MYHGQVLAPDDLLKEHGKLEEGFWTFCPKQRHINIYHISIPLRRLGLDVDLKGIRLVHWGIADGRVGLVADWERRPTIIPVIFREL